MSTTTVLPASATTISPPAPERDQDVGRLLLSCEDRPGIVSAVCTFLFDRGANITDLQQHSTDPQGGRLFLRMEFLLPEMQRRLPDLEGEFTALADSLELEWRFSCAAQVKRLAIMVSTADHALQELLWRQHAGDLHAEIVMVLSNHDRLRPLAESWGIPFHHIPVVPGQKELAEQQQLDLLRGNVDAVVLARYMQILSPQFLREYPLRAINIHHSFLPAFVGADPYGRAAARGVKLIGATAHYVTADLDEGPIIEQDVARIDHRQSVADLRRAGRYIERSVLARAVAWHTEDRVLVFENKTIVFS
jgi:formyltetrahydrofolate deformylase